MSMKSANAAYSRAIKALELLPLGPERTQARCDAIQAWDKAQQQKNKRLEKQWAEAERIAHEAMRHI